jgi:hypothetical protein
MTEEREGKNQAAADLVRKRWDKTSPKKRSAIAKGLAEARWGKKKKKNRRES